MKIRLFVEDSFKIGGNLVLNKNQSHYLIKVLRCELGQEVYLFNNRDGEFLAELTRLAPLVELKLLEKKSEIYFPPNLSLSFAPVKNVKTEYLVTKATELGVGEIRPIVTDYTIVRKVNLEKNRLNIIEAAEQCGRTDLPEIKNIEPLNNFLGNLSDENLVFADESLASKQNHRNDFSDLDKEYKTIVLIGPEGGFSEKERNLIKSYYKTISLSLGPRILRADTAIMSSLALLREKLETCN